VRIAVLQRGICNLGKCLARKQISLHFIPSLISCATWVADVMTSPFLKLKVVNVNPQRRSLLPQLCPYSFFAFTVTRLEPISSLSCWLARYTTSGNVLTVAMFESLMICSKSPTFGSRLLPIMWCRSKRRFCLDFYFFFEPIRNAPTIRAYRL
jgi:hypothetical protein